MRLSTGFEWRRTLVSVTAASALSCAFWLQRVSLFRWVAFTMAQPSLRLRYPSTPARRVSRVRLPDTAVSPRFSPLRTSRWAGGDAFTPASGGQDLHLHKDRVARPFRLAACPEVLTSFQPTGRTIHFAAKSKATLPLSWLRENQRLLKTQAFASAALCAFPCRDTVLIGKMFTARMLASSTALCSWQPLSRSVERALQAPGDG